MARLLLCLSAVLLTLALTASARDLKQAQPALNIKWPGGGLTGGENGEPFKVAWRGGSTTIGKIVNKCGQEDMGIVVKHKSHSTVLDTGAGCKPATVDVKAGGTSTTVALGTTSAAGKPVKP